MLLAAIVVGTAGVVTWLLCGMMGMESRIATGLFAGACTSTPAFAAATESVDAQGMSAIGAGYAVAYPFGVVGVVLFVQLLPRLLRKNLDAPSDEQGGEKDPQKIISRVVTVTNPEAIGRNIDKYLADTSLSCRITREVKDGILLPPDADAVFTEGMQVCMVGERAKLLHEVGMLGHIEPAAQHPRRFGDESAELIVLAQSLCNKTLREADTLNNYGILISRITRLGATFAAIRQKKCGSRRAEAARCVEGNGKTLTDQRGEQRTCCWYPRPSCSQGRGHHSACRHCPPHPRNREPASGR